jgi:hypothetical protein
MNKADIKATVLNGNFSSAVAMLDMDGSILTTESRNLITAACQDIADEHGFGKAVEAVIHLSRELKFLLADPEVDELETVEIPLGTGTAVGRLESNPNRAHRGDIKTLIARGIVNTAATEESWMYEKWPAGQKGTAAPLNGEQSGWAHSQEGAIKCFLCSGLGEGREIPVNPNEIFISCPGPKTPIYAGCNFAALASYHMTAFRREQTQQRVDGDTLEQTLALLENLQNGVDGAQPFTVIHNGDLTISFTDEGKPAMKGVGATLMHDHNQFMRADLPIMHADYTVEKENDGVSVDIVSWPSSVIRVAAPATSRQAFLDTANVLITTWQAKDPANTVNQILTTDGNGTLILFLPLRRIGMVDAPEKSCVASLEQSGIIVLDDHSVFEKYEAADEAGRREFLEGVLQSVDPLYQETGGDKEKCTTMIKSMITE